MKVFVLKLWEWLFVAFLFLLPWQTRLILRPGVLNGGNWEYGIIGVYGTEILLWLVTAIFFFSQIARRGIKILNIKYLIFNIQYLIFLISLISLILLSLFVSVDRALTWQSWRYIFEAFIALFLIRRHSRTGWLIGGFLSGLAAQSILGIWQFLAQDTFASHWLGLTLHPAWQAGSAVLEGDFGRWLRAYGGLPHPNILGGYLAIGLVLIIFIILKLSLNKGQDIKEIKTLDIKKIFLFIVYCLLFTALFFTFSRGALLASAAVLLLFGFIALRNKKYLISNIQYLISISLILFVIFSLLFSPLFYSRFSGVGRLEVQSTSERLAGYSEAWSLFEKHPLIGVGLGNYTLAVHQELDASRSAWAYQPVHNVFLLILTETGLLGFIFFAVFFLSTLKIFNIQYSISLISIISLISLIFIISLFDHYLWSLYSGWMLLAVGGGLALSSQAKDVKI